MIKEVDSFKKRDTQPDLVRVIAMIFVICVHLPIDFTANNIVLTVKEVLFLTCNGMFYMLSGKFNLRFEPGNDASLSYKNYYLKKIKGIIIPYLIYSIILYAYSVRETYFVLGIEGCIRGFAETFFNLNATSHIWFMYALIGMLVGAPFLAKMLKSLSDHEIEILVGIALAWNFINIIVVKNLLMIDSRYSGWFLNEWILYFILGLCCDRVVDKRRTRLVIVIGLGAVILTIIQRIYFGNRVQNIFDISPIYTFVTLGMYLFFERICIINNKIIKKVVEFVAKYSFGVYMLHMVVLWSVLEKLGNADGPIQWILEVLVIFVVSFALSFIIDSCIVKPVVYFLFRKLKMPTQRKLKQ